MDRVSIMFYLPQSELFVMTSYITEFDNVVFIVWITRSTWEERESSSAIDPLQAKGWENPAQRRCWVDSEQGAPNTGHAPEDPKQVEDGGQGL